MRDEIDQYTTAGVRPFGVNPASVASHRRYAEAMRFPFLLLSDAERAVADAYGALKPDRKGIQRSVVLIRRDGVVVFAERGMPGPDRSLPALADGS